MRIPSFSLIFRLCGISSLQRLSIARRRNTSKLETFAIVFSIQCRKMSKKVSDYGTWKSVISSQLACSGGAAYSSDLQVDPITGWLFWSEVRSKEGGRCVVVSYNPDTCETVVWTPEGFNVRSRVHEYGGGAFLVHNGRLYFSNNQDQRLYRQDGPNQTPIPLIPPQLQLRFADGHYCPKHNKIFCVAEDHSVLEKGATQPENRLVCVDPENEGAPITIEEGADFYSGPRVSPDGTRLVWMQWNHPNMPFESTEIMVAGLNDAGDSLLHDSKQLVAGKKNVSVMVPSWSHKGDIYYIGDESGWYNLYCVGDVSKPAVNLHPVSQELGFPRWVFGNRGYDCERNSSHKIVTVHGTELGMMDHDGNNYEVLHTGFSSPTANVQFSIDGKSIFCIVEDSRKFPAVVQLHLDDSKKVDVIAESVKSEIDSSYFSIPQHITFPTTDNQVAHANLYLPQNPNFEGPAGSLPPVLLKVHGGPTGNCSSSLNLQYQYYTSRGFAIVDVDFRGSIGYGTEYRNLLKGRWGKSDIEDCEMAVKYLTEQKLVDSERVCIEGGSSGGFAVLACLTFTNAFKAGSCRYGIGDIRCMNDETHKFESKYLSYLIGPFPESEQLCMDRSPILHLDKLACPVILFHGGKDQVVFPSESEKMYKAVKEKGLPTAYICFPDEGHGFKSSEAKQTTLEGTFYFFSQVLGFTPAEPCKAEIPIVNL